MANIAVHLAAAQEWAKKHNVDNLDDFLWGAVAPDILGKLTSRSETHYDDLPNSIVDDDMSLRFNSEANIEKFLAKNPIKTDYDKGYLFHLLVDKYFYNDFLKIDRLYKISHKYSEVKPYIYQTYDATLDFVNKKYSVRYENSHKEMAGLRERYGSCAISEPPTLYTSEELAEFIDSMAELDLEKYINNSQFEEEENVR